MLALPLQKAEPLDVTSPLTQYLQKQYGDGFIEVLTSDVATFQQLRRNAVLVTEATEANVQTILRYHYHMYAIVPRLAAFQDDLKLRFVWCDGFKPANKITTNSFYVDWACTLWNVGAVESQIAAKIDRSSEEGIRGANKHFTQAAGIFDYIRKTVLPNISTPSVSGLTDDGLQMASQLMLAQAQFCFYEKVQCMLTVKSYP